MHVLDITLINGNHRGKKKTENFKAVSLKKSEYTVKYKTVKEYDSQAYSLVIWSFKSQFSFVVIVDKISDGNRNTVQFNSKSY